MKYFAAVGPGQLTTTGNTSSATIKKPSGLDLACSDYSHRNEITQAKVSVPLDISCRFTHTPTIFLRRLLIISISFHVAYETFFFTQFFETPYHLLYRFTCPRFNFQHTERTFPCFRRQKQPQNNIISNYFVKILPGDYTKAKSAHFQVKKKHPCGFLPRNMRFVL